MVFSKWRPNRKIFANTVMIFLIENYELSEKTPRVKKFLELVEECTQIFPTAVEKIFNFLFMLNLWKIQKLFITLTNHYLGFFGWFVKNFMQSLCCPTITIVKVDEYRYSFSFFSLEFSNFLFFFFEALWTIFGFCKN